MLEGNFQNRNTSPQNFRAEQFLRCAEATSSRKECRLPELLLVDRKSSERKKRKLIENTVNSGSGWPDDLSRSVAMSMRIGIHSGVLMGERLWKRCSFYRPELFVLVGCLSSLLWGVSCRGLVIGAANQTVQLSVKVTGSGTGTISSSPSGINCGQACTASFTVDTQVTLTATPSADSAFAGWQGVCSGTSTCVVNLSAGMSVSATFLRRPTMSRCVTEILLND